MEKYVDQLQCDLDEVYLAVVYEDLLGEKQDDYDRKLIPGSLTAHRKGMPSSDPQSESLTQGSTGG